VNRKQCQFLVLQTSQSSDNPTNPVAGLHYVQDESCFGGGTLKSPARNKQICHTSGGNSYLSVESRATRRMRMNLRASFIGAGLRVGKKLSTCCKTFVALIGKHLGQSSHSCETKSSVS
jgi:hypothetical protein